MSIYDDYKKQILKELEDEKKKALRELKASLEYEMLHELYNQDKDVKEAKLAALEAIARKEEHQAHVDELDDAWKACRATYAGIH